MAKQRLYISLDRDLLARLTRCKAKLEAKMATMIRPSTLVELAVEQFVELVEKQEEGEE